MQTAITSMRLSLRPFAQDDAAEVFAAITPTLTKFMGWEPPTPSEFERIWRGWLTAAQDESDLHWVVRSTESGEFLGLTGLHRDRGREPELGIWIKEAAHGHGYGREAVVAVVGWASQRFATKAFIYPVAVENTASRRIAEALNGVIQGSRDRVKFEEVVYLVPAP